jgi:hypothetical protein
MLFEHGGGREGSVGCLFLRSCATTFAGVGWFFPQDLRDFQACPYVTDFIVAIATVAVPVHRHCPGRLGKSPLLQKPSTAQAYVIGQIAGQLGLVEFRRLCVGESVVLE